MTCTVIFHDCGDPWDLNVHSSQGICLLRNRSNMLYNESIHYTPGAYILSALLF